MDEKKCVEYIELKIANIDLADSLGDILDKIEELKIEGRKINEKLESNKKKCWSLAKELDMVKTTTVPQGEISNAIYKGLEISAKKNYVKNMLK